jgi:hypothetical protein
MIDSRWCHWIFQWHISFRPYRGPGVDSAPSENEYHENFLGVKAARHHLNVSNFMKSDSLNLLQPSGPHRACYGAALPLRLLLRMRNVVDKIKTHFLWPISFKRTVDTERPQALCLLETQGHKHTVRISNTCCFPTASIVARTHVHVTSYAYCLSFIVIACHRSNCCPVIGRNLRVPLWHVSAAVCG